MEEVSWIQKPRERLTKLGDRNTRYFHRIAKFNRRKNFIDNIVVNGINVSGQEDLESSFVAFFRDLYSEPYSVCQFPSRLHFGRVPQEVVADLTTMFFEKEIWEAVRRCASEKEPSPDGFSFCFFKRCWRIIKEDICHAVWKFQAEARLPKMANRTFLVLIPKKVAIGKDGVYKILSKCLLHRLKPCMTTIISQ
ncbi:LINE-1 retrotransposable element ORF2 protein [Linum perenne]